MKHHIAAASALAVLFLGTSAFAASITNLDSKEYSFSVIEEDKTTDYTVSPSQMIENLCPNGCLIRLNSGEKDEFEFQPEDVVVIEDGQLYLDPSSTSQGDNSTEFPPEQEMPAEEGRQQGLRPSYRLNTQNRLGADTFLSFLSQPHC
jgi:hypothetical protein